MTKKAHFGLLFLLLMLLLGQGMPSAGHGYIVRSIPADRSVLSRAPNQVQIWFSEGLEPQFSTIEVLDQTGRVVSTEGGGVDPQNSAKLVADLPAGLPAGAYLVRLRPVFTSDGHAVSDTMVFWVGSQTGELAAGGAETSRYAVPLEVLWRVLLTLSLILLGGVFWSYVLVLRPAWAGASGQLGGLPARVIGRLRLMLWGALLLALLSNSLALLQTSMELFDAGLGQVLDENLWNIVLQGTNFGDLWQLRTLLLLAILLVQVVAAQQLRNRPRNAHYLWLLNAFLVLAALGTMSFISHAAGSPFWRFVSVLVDYLHLLSVALWLGGVIVLALLLRPALLPLDAAARGQALRALLRRFSPLAAGALAIVIATGIYNSSLNIARPADLVNTPYGVTLLAKLLMLLPLLMLGALHYATLSPQRLQQATAWLDRARSFARLPQSLQLEMLFALLILLAAALLPATPPPTPPQARGDVAASSQSLALEDYRLTLSVNPGAVGANAYDVQVMEGAAPAALEAVRLRFVYPEYGRYSPPLLLGESEPGLWVGADGSITRAATWNAYLDLYPSSGDVPVRAAFRWPFASEVRDQNAPQPGLANYVSLGLILLVLAGAILPGVYGYLRALDWRPETLFIAALALGLTLAVSGAGAIIFNRTSQQVQERRDPPATYVNPVFGDQAALLEGKAIYEQECLDCHGLRGLQAQDSTIMPLPQALQQRDDDFLWRILSNGIVGRHPYGLELSDEARWKLILYLRSFE